MILRVLTVFVCLSAAFTFGLLAILMLYARATGGPDWMVTLTFNTAGEGLLEVAVATILAITALVSGLFHSRSN